MRLLKLSLILICLVASSLCYINQISKDKNLWAYSNLNLIGNASTEINLCFSGVDKNTQVMIIKESNVNNLNEIFSTSVTIRDSIFTKNLYKIEEVSFDPSTYEITLQSPYFRNFEPATTYCLQFTTMKDPTSIKQLSLLTATSNITNRIEYSMRNSFTEIQLYSTPTESNVAAVHIAIPSNAFNPSVIHEDTFFNLKLTVSVAIAAGQYLPTASDQTFFFIELPNIDVSNATINLFFDSTKITLSSTPYYELRDSKILLYNLGKNLVNGDTFSINIGNIIALNHQYFSGNVIAIASLYWKNTNSLVSYFKLDTQVPITKYVLSSLAFSHVNNSPFIYASSTWPMQFSFTITKPVVRANLTLKDNNGVVQFIPGTCDFSINSTRNTKCDTNNGTSQLNINNITLFANELFTVRVWVYLLPSSNPNININNIISLQLTAQMVNQTIAFPVTPSFIVKSGTINIDDNINYPNQCLDINNNTETPLNCDGRLIINENVGNFFLLENDVYSKTDFNVYQPRELGDFQTLQDDYFRLRFRYNVPNNQAISQTWSGEWQADNLPHIQNSDFSFGTHNLYFPVDFYTSSGTQVCKFSWGTNYQAIKTSANFFNPTTIDLNYKYEVNAGPTQALYNNFIQFSGLTQQNKLYFKNYNDVSTQKVLQTGLFYSLVRSVECDPQFSNCVTADADVTANGNQTSFELEFASNCFTYADSFNYMSIYTSYDLLHTFNLNTNNTTPKYFMRANRFVSLLPQPGIFKLVDTNIKVNTPLNSNIFVQGFVFQDSNEDELCILELEFSQLSLATSNYSTAGVNLQGFFYGLNVIDFEDMTNYPTNKHSLSVSKNPYMNISNYKHGWLNLSDFSTIFQGTNYGTYSNTITPFYFGHNFQFTINTSAINSNNTSNSGYSNRIIVPIKCNTQDYIYFQFSDIRTYNNQNTSQVIYEPIINYYDNNNPEFGFFSKQRIYGGYSATSQVQMIATWQDFVFQYNTELTFTQKSLNTSFKTENSIRYLALLTKDPLASNERLLDYNNVEVPTSSYIELVAQNPFVFNGVRFTNLLIKDRIFSSSNINSNIFNIKNNSNNFVFSLQGVPVHINSNGPVKNGDVGLFISGKSDASGENANFMITNFDGTNFLVNVPVVNNIVNDSTVVGAISYTTKRLKNGNAVLSTCASVTLVLLANVNYFKIYSTSFTPRTIAEGQGFNGDFSYSTNMFKGKAPVFTDITVTNSIVISFCNIDISAVKKFSITKVTYFFKDQVTPYYDYTLTSTQVVTSINSSATYSAGVISGYSFENTRATYGDLTLEVTLDNEVFRDMILTINANLSSIQIDSSIMPSCVPYFGTFDNPHNTLWESCVVDLNAGKIIITTFNEIRVYDPIENVFNIIIHPAKIANLDSITWTIQQRFNNVNDQNVVLSPEEARTVENNSAKFKLASFTPMEISNKLQFVSIEPYYPNIPGMINLQVNFFNDLTVKSYIDNNTIVINSIRLHFPIKYYGPPPVDDLICYVNQVRIDNCIVDKENIYIRTTIDITQNISIGIYGYLVPKSNQINIANSTVLVSLSYMQTFSRLDYFYGKVKLPDNFDPTLFVTPSTVNVANLRVVSQTYGSFSPGDISYVTLNLDVDNLGGIATITPFTIPSINGFLIYITLPRDINFASSDKYFNSGNNVFKPELSIKISYADSTSLELKQTVITLNNVQYRGSLIYGTIKSETEYKLDTYFRGFQIKITNVRTSNLEDTTGIFNVSIVKTNLYRLSTFTFLNSSVGQSNPYLPANPLQQTLVADRLGFIEYFRGTSFIYSLDKYYFNLSYNATLLPGILGPIGVTVSSKSKIRNAFTTLIPNFQNSLLSSLYSSYNIDGRQNLTTTIFAGVSCGTYPGKFILRVDSSNTTNFHAFPNIIFTVSEASAKNVIMFYSDISGKVPTVYSSNTNIIMGRGAYVNFWIKPVSINKESITINFTSRINDGTTVSPPNPVVIQPLTTNYVTASFSSPLTSMNAIQSYNVIVGNNLCFVSAVDRIYFFPNLVMETFQNYEIQMADFIYQNAQTVLNLDGILTNVHADQINFYVNYNKGSTLPVPSNLYCALYCSDRDPLTIQELQTLPSPVNSWYLSFFYKQIKTSDRFIMSFDNLVRDKDYTLQCYLETSDVVAANRSSVVRTQDQINGTYFEPEPTPILLCADFYMKNITNTPNFEQVAADILQEHFYSTWEQKGCVLSIDSNKNFIQGYQNNYFDCLDTNSINVFNTTSDNSNPVIQSNASVVAQRGSRILNSNNQNNRRLQAQNGNNATTNNNSINYNNTNNNTTDNKTQTTSQAKQVNLTQYIGGFQPFIKQYYRVCLVQYPICPNPLDINTVETMLNSLLGPPPKLNQQILGLRNLQNTTNANASSLFYSKLSPAEQNNFNFYTYKYIDPGFDFTAANISLSYSSNFSVYSESKSNYTQMTFTFNAKVDEVTCFWAMNTNLMPDSYVSVDSILNCDPSSNIVCGDPAGIELPAQVTYNFNTYDLQDKDFAIWLTCRQNAVIARLYSIPNLGLRVTSYFERSIVAPENYVYSCKLGNSEFPACCKTRETSQDDPSICYSKYLNSGFLILLLLISLLFN